MTIDPARVSLGFRVECTLHDDSRLMVGITEIVGHAAERVGLSEKEQKDFKAAVVEACREAFLLAHRTEGTSATIKLAAADLPNLVEVTIECSAAARAAGVDPSGKAATLAAGIPKAPTGPRAAGVQREVREGRFYVTVAKSNGASKSERKV
jgi:hypothetical protein